MPNLSWTSSLLTITTTLWSWWQWSPKFSIWLWDSGTLNPGQKSQPFWINRWINWVPSSWAPRTTRPENTRAKELYWLRRWVQKPRRKSHDRDDSHSLWGEYRKHHFYLERSYKLLARLVIFITGPYAPSSLYTGSYLILMMVLQGSYHLDWTEEETEAQRGGRCGQVTELRFTLTHP